MMWLIVLLIIQHKFDMWLIVLLIIQHKFDMWLIVLLIIQHKFDDVAHCSAYNTAQV